MKTSLKTQLALSVSALMLATSFSTASFAQETAVADDEVITTGTRRKARSAADTPAPVDVISGAEFTNQATSDIGELLRTVVPSYNVNAQPISDAATIIRPANLRGLSPDNTLVLLNGKRRHRGSVIAFLGGGIADGSQGVDVAVFPSLALKQVEVLRDGASSQYGSDAIAGVINFKLKDSAEGGMVEAKYGSTYEGDGTEYRISGNVGLPLGENGFINVTAEYGQVEGTSRSVQIGDVDAIIAAGNTNIAGNESLNQFTTDVVQYWGTPQIDDDFKLFVNSAVELTENAEVYAFGNYAQRTATGGFFWRGPAGSRIRGQVYAGPQVNPLTGNTVTSTTNDNGTPMDLTDDFDELIDDKTGVVVAATTPSVLVGDLDGLGNANTCPNGIPLTGANNLTTDPTILAQVEASANCFSFRESEANGGIPGGFTPRFGGDNRDIAFTAGFRGELDFGNGLGYDLSASYGSNKTEFFIRNTINASLGPNTPRDFKPGAYEQKETAVNLDLNYGVPIEGWASDLNIASGVEWRNETFDITAGDAASTALGPLASQGFASSSNGFGGFQQTISESQSNLALYTELEADISDAFTLQTALRYEDNEKFGDTVNYKVAGLYKLTDAMRLRGAYSTGFHTPTSGQANVTNVTTANTNGVLADEGTIPLFSAPGQLAADFVESTAGVRPEFGPETAKNISLGVAFETGPMSWTVDYFNIKVKDRIATTDNIDFLSALDFLANREGVTGAAYDNSSVSSALTTLGAAGALNRADFAGFEDLTAFKFFTNGFSTKTTGWDIVGRMPFDMGAGSSSVQVAANYTNTKVTDVGSVAPIGANRIRALEDLLPAWRGNVTFNHEQGMWRGLLRANYYGAWRDTGNGFDVGSEILFDAEIGAQVMDNVEIIVGAANLLNNYPDENPGKTNIGQLYPEAGPFGFNGGQYYVKGRMTF